jgi:F-type H+-transporting ATPase subunit epsilon
MAAFAFELVSPERILFSGEVDQVVVPGTEGDFAVLKDHAPVMSSLRAAVLTIDASGKPTQRMFIRGGFADVSPNGLTVLAEQAIPVEEVTPDTLHAEAELAEAEFAKATSDEGRRAAKERLAQIVELRAGLFG